MFVQVKSNLQSAAFSDVEQSHSQIPELWPKLERHLQKQIAHCWANLIHRILQRRAEKTGGKRGTDV